MSIWFLLKRELVQLWRLPNKPYDVLHKKDTYQAVGPISMAVAVLTV